MKPTELAKIAADLEKSLKSAIFSLQSADTLHARKNTELEACTSNTKTIQTLKIQLGESKALLDTALQESRMLMVCDFLFLFFSSLICFYG